MSSDVADPPGPRHPARTLDNPIRRMIELGQSIWLDDLSRTLLTGHELAGWIVDDGVSGLTANAGSVRRAIEAGAYDPILIADRRRNLSLEQLYSRILIEDAAEAADMLRARYDASAGAEGFVSIDIAPRAAHSSKAIEAEATALWLALDRPNILIRIPATDAAIPAVTALLGDGVNVNATSIFGVHRYRQISRAHLEALEARLIHGQRVADITSAATLFVSAIDAAVDAELHEGDLDVTALPGEAGTIVARSAYHHFQDVLPTPRWRAVAARGARPQRLVWAGTTSPNPNYGDLKYVHGPLAAGAVAVLSPETLQALRDHGRPSPRLADDREYVRAVRRQLQSLGIDLERIATRLEAEAYEHLLQAYDTTIEALRQRLSTISSSAKAV